MQCFYQTVLSTTRQLCGQFQFQLKLKLQLPTTLNSSSLCQLHITKITNAVSITNNNNNITKTFGPETVHETELFFEKEVNLFSCSKSALVAVPILNSESLSKILQNSKRNCKHQDQEKNCSCTFHNLLGSSRYHNRNLDLIYKQPQKYSQLKFQQAEAQILKVSLLLEEEEEYKEKRKIMSLPNVVFVLGGPGAGKGTQCSKIVETFGFVHLSAGDLLREERNKPGSEYGELIEKHIRDGTIVPVEITCSLIARAMENSPTKNFLIDGFPRSQNNLDGWEAEMTGKVNVLFVLFFDAPEDVCVARCLQRGQAGSGRSDDNPESLKKRVFTYMNDTMPIIEHFKKQDLVRRIDAGQDADAVFQEVSTCFKDVV